MPVYIEIASTDQHGLNTVNVATKNVATNRPACACTTGRPVCLRLHGACGAAWGGRAMHELATVSPRLPLGKGGDGLALENRRIRTTPFGGGNGSRRVL